MSKLPLLGMLYPYAKRSISRLSRGNITSVLYNDSIRVETSLTEDGHIRVKVDTKQKWEHLLTLNAKVTDGVAQGELTIEPTKESTCETTETKA